jgi:cyanate lyase
VAFVDSLLAAKAASGKTYDEIAAALGVTNAYAAQLFYNQAQLKPEAAPKLKAAVPQLRWVRGCKCGRRRRRGSGGACGQGWPLGPHAGLTPAPCLPCPRRSEEALAIMQQAPMRSYDPHLQQEPHVYRMLEVGRGRGGEGGRAGPNNRCKHRWVGSMRGFMECVAVRSSSVNWAVLGLDEDGAG